MQQIGVEKILDPLCRARDAAGVDSVIVVNEAMINPFNYERSELINIYSEVVASPLCQEDLIKAYKCGKEAQHHCTARFISDPKELLHP